ncbi:pleckstrin-like domain-containing protein [Apiospora marii]|uniref:Pleckstrin-like domain-containing protein n=1 Tax=Apiospora marii TaxID=335849 RepID=A0ABR1RGG3_9PEZI
MADSPSEDDAIVPDEPPPAYDELSSSVSQLPRYLCDIVLDAVLRMKMEIEETVKRAAGRQHWLTVLMLQYRRRYVIRVRAETDQFLLSCVELPSFVLWLDALSAAINVAPVIDEREFPKDQSLPRVTRSAASSRDTTASSDSSRPGRPSPVIHHSAMTPRYPCPSSLTEPRSHPTPDDDASPGNPPPSLSQIPADQLTGHKWRVDWTTGRMVRVVPLGYFDDEQMVSGGGPPLRV